jgi:demethylmenaquinone methyltransferase / 2-methoxy-6-polyprenyl-1,4-benzoquinol methylase
MTSDWDTQLADRRESFRIFDAIQARYDLLNHLLSLGLDFGWRRRLAAALPNREHLRLLDLACGTGDLLFASCRRRPDTALACGCDMSLAMLRRAQNKAGRRRSGRSAVFVRGDGGFLPFRDAAFDVVTMAFGIRNMVDPVQVLRELARVLTPGGRLLILEFSLPSNRMFKMLHRIYLRHFLPRLGAWISGDPQAYRYLDRTIESFPYGPAFCRWMSEAGYIEVTARPLSGGVVALYQGGRPV